MAFAKGNKSGKGRPKGAENKEKRKLREFLAAVLDNNQDKFNKELAKLDGVQFIAAYSNLLEYSTPKLQRTDINNKSEIDYEKLSIDELRTLASISRKLRGGDSY